MTRKVDAGLPDWRHVARPPDAPTASAISLSPELMAEASRRLGWLGVTYAVGSIVTHFGHRALLLLSGSTDIGLRAADAFGLSTVALALGVYAVSRLHLLSHERLLELGFAFQVLGAIDIAATRAWTAVLQTPDAMWGLVPAECVWIVVYPLVVPSVPRKALLASLLAASPGPVAVVLAATFGGAVIDRPAAIAVYYVMTTYTCAVSAYAVSRMVYGLRLRLKHAREIGSYELIDKIGEGGMGEVWRARHRLLARPAAIKLIRRELLGSSHRTREAAVRRFEREARDTATLRSIHTIDVYDFGVTRDGDFYYVMELLDGISLERFVERFGPMEPARVAFVLRQVCHSLIEAHARGLIHRDIKPANIFLCRLGPDDDFVKVLDFGLVKHVHAAPGTMLTGQGETAGTPAYMAPEIALANAALDGRADIYSIGCVAYFLLTGAPVFSNKVALATVLAHVQEDPVPPSERSEFEIPPALEALTLQCLAKDPSARPASASELADRLAETVPPPAWTTEAARRWWELHDPQPQPFAVHDADGRVDKRARYLGKDSRLDEISTHTPVYTLAAARFPDDEAQALHLRAARLRGPLR
jgi:eukaryotic-like serine/threonine-protein kinase